METQQFLLGKWSTYEQFSIAMLSYQKVMPRITWSLSARSCAESTPVNRTMSGAYREWGEVHDSGNARCQWTRPQLHPNDQCFGWFALWFVGQTISRMMTTITVIPRESHHYFTPAWLLPFRCLVVNVGMGYLWMTINSYHGSFPIP